MPQYTDDITNTNKELIKLAGSLEGISEEQKEKTIDELFSEKLKDISSLESLEERFSKHKEVVDRAQKLEEVKHYKLQQEEKMKVHLESIKGNELTFQIAPEYQETVTIEALVKHIKKLEEKIEALENQLYKSRKVRRNGKGSQHF